MHEIPVFIGATWRLSLAAATVLACSLGLVIGAMYAIELVARVWAAITHRMRNRGRR